MGVGVAAEVWIRIGCFLGVLLLMWLWEWRRPKRSNKIKRSQRWRSNLSLVVVNTLSLRILIPAGAVGAALWSTENNFGLLQWTDWPGWVIGIIGLIILDVAIYWQHRLFHTIPLLWRIHRVHHADPEFDTTTGLRFHPLEILLSMGIKIGVVLAFGIPLWAVITFEVVLNATSLFTHGNVALPRWLEAPFRALIVTQEMHRIHHSQRKEETNSNYCFNLSVWDRLFRSYTRESKDGSDGIRIGLKQYQDVTETTGLKGMLAIPFRDPKQD